jgi:hypothetical protein
MKMSHATRRERLLQFTRAAFAIGAACSCAGELAPHSGTGQWTPAASYATLPLHFEPNLRQHDPAVQFSARSPSYGIFLTAQEAVIRIPARSAPSSAQPSRDVALGISLLGSDPAARARGVGRLPGESHYFLGASPERIHTGVPHFAQVRYDAVYPGVDLVYYGRGAQLEYDFILAPGRDPAAIQLAFAGATALRVDEQGDLRVSVGSTELLQRRPIAYQELAGERRELPARYVLGDGRVGFAVDGRDPSRELVIDPVLVYSTYLGGSDGERGSDVAVDADGNAYVTGHTFSLDFPTTRGALQREQRGASDAFVSKLDRSGSVLLYSTYLGGSASDFAQGIAVDRRGHAYVTGSTDSADFPVTGEALQPVLRGGSDAFVAKLSARGSALLYATYLGGSSDDRAEGIALDADERAHVAGTTGSVDFPTTPGSVQAKAPPFEPQFPLDQRSDGFAARLNARGSRLGFSTYLGGSREDHGNGIAVDRSGAVFVSGSTSSSDFPVTRRAVQPTLGGATDLFATRLDRSGSRLGYSTYLGGSSGEVVGRVEIDAAGHAYVLGTTASRDYPTTPGAFQTEFTGPGFSDIAFSVLDRAGSSLLYSTYIGGRAEDFASGLAVDSRGRAHIAGLARGPGFPTTADAFQSGFGGGDADAVIVRLRPRKGSGLEFSSYLGGPGFDGGSAVAVASRSSVVVTGFADADFPTTEGALQREFGGGREDAFLARIREDGRDHDYDED